MTSLTGFDLFLVIAIPFALVLLHAYIMDKEFAKLNKRIDRLAAELEAAKIAEPSTEEPTDERG